MEAVKTVPGALVGILLEQNVKAPTHVAFLFSALSSVGYGDSIRGFVGLYCLGKWKGHQHRE